MRNPKRTLLVLLALAASGAAGVSWWRRAHGMPAKEPGAPAAARAIRRDFSSSILATGAVKAQVGAEVRVGARISGKVQRLHANIGDTVKKGDVIAELENDDLKAVVAQRRAELQLADAKLAAVESLLPVQIEQADAEARRRQATLDLARKEQARQDDLLKGDSTSVQLRDQAQEQLLVAEALLAAAFKTQELTRKRQTEELKQARAECERAKAALAFDEAQLSYATLAAPIGGVIGSVSTQEGETVAAGLNAPTFVTIIDLARLQVDAYVDEVDIGKVRIGQPAVFSVDAFPGREFQGQAAAIYPKALLQDNVVYYDVVIEIHDAYENLLRPEMTANVTIFLEKRSNVLAIPGKALRRDRGKTVVRVPADGQTETREIQVGWKDGEWVEVVKGLAEGDLVIVESAASQPTAP